MVGDPSEIDFFVHGTTVGLNAATSLRGTRVLVVARHSLCASVTAMPKADADDVWRRYLHARVVVR